MFTGIIQTTGRIAWVDKQERLMRIAIECPDEVLPNLQTGASISINGVCLTVVAQDKNLVLFDIMAETLSRTTLQDLKPNQSVNVERSLKFGDEVGGHILSGHIMGTAQVQEISQPSPEQKVLVFNCPKEWMKFILPKGYIGLHGASLTVVDTFTNGFSVHLIPETLKITNLKALEIGDSVNIEIDYQTQLIVTSVERYLDEKDKIGKN